MATVPTRVQRPESGHEVLEATAAEAAATTGPVTDVRQ